MIALVVEEVGLEEGGLTGMQDGVNRPVLLRDERAYLHFALDDETQGSGLNALGGKSAANLVPENGRNFVADNAIEHPAGLLRVNEVGIHLPGMIEGRANRLRRNFIKRNPKNLLRIDGNGFFLGIDLVFFFDSFFGCRLFLLKSRNAGFLLDELGSLGEDYRALRRNGFALAIGVA